MTIYRYLGNYEQLAGHEVYGNGRVDVQILWIKIVFKVLLRSRTHLPWRCIYLLNVYYSFFLFIPVSYCWTTSIPVVTIGNNTLRDHFVGVDDIQDGIYLRLKVNNILFCITQSFFCSITDHIIAFENIMCKNYYEYCVITSTFYTSYYINIKLPWIFLL